MAPDALDERLWTWQAALLVLLGMTVAWPHLLLRRTRLRLASAVAATGTPPQDGGASAALGRALGDQTLRLLYPRADDRLLDITGQPHSAGRDGLTLTWLTRRTSSLAVLHDQRALARLDPADLSDLVPRAVGLAIDEELLLVQREEQLRQLEESRRRIVAEADRVRRSLERDLHDGAQQRLVGLALALRLARLQLDNPSTVLEEAEDLVVEALTELREIAHGIYPAELADAGLVPALESLAEDSTTLQELRVDVRVRPPAEVASAAYFAVVNSLRDAEPDAAASVEVVERDEELRILVQFRGAPTDVSRLRIEDRATAVGGTCLIRTHSGRCRLEVSLPCES